MVEKELWTLEDVANYFRVSKRTVYNWVKWGRLKSYRPATRHLFDPEEVEAFRDSQSTHNK